MAYYGNQKTDSNKHNTKNKKTEVSDTHYLGAVTASAFYDSFERKTLRPPAITNIINDHRNRVLVSRGDGTAVAFKGLSFNGDSLLASAYFGSGVGLTNLQASALVGNVPLKNINYGAGLVAANNQLQVNIAEGLVLTNNQVGIKTTAKGGLRLTPDGIRVDPSMAPEKRAVSINDRFLISDSDNQDAAKGVAIRYLSNYFQNTLNFSQPSGRDAHIQFNNNGRFGSSPHLTFRGETLATINVSARGHIQVGTNLLKADRTMLALPSVPIDNSTLPNNGLCMYIDEEQNKLMLKVKYSTGVVRNIAVDLIERAIVQEEDDESENQGFIMDDESMDEKIGINNPNDLEELDDKSFQDIESPEIEMTDPNNPSPSI